MFRRGGELRLDQPLIRVVAKFADATAAEFWQPARHARECRGRQAHRDRFNDEASGEICGKVIDDDEWQKVEEGFTPASPRRPLSRSAAGPDDRR